MAFESQGTKLEIAGSSGGAETITDIAVGNPTKLTVVGHSLSNGDVVTLANFAGDDAATLNSQVAVVQFVTDDTFAVAIDTTGMTITDNTNAATATPLAWTAIGEVTDCNKEDPGANEIEVTHLMSTAKEFLVGLQDSGTYSLSVNFLFADAGQLALKAAQADRIVRTFRVTYSNDATMTFNGFVQTFNGPGASVDDKLTGDVAIKISGLPVFA